MASISIQEYYQIENTLDWKSLFKRKRYYCVDTKVRDKKHVVNSAECHNESGGRKSLWGLSENYYSLAWSLYTSGCAERSSMPYGGDGSDNHHRRHLLEIGMECYEGYYTLAHMSCELALKSIHLHLCKNDAFYLNGHDLHKLLVAIEDINQEAYRDILVSCSGLNYGGVGLVCALEGSGERFVNQRYNGVDWTKSLDRAFAPIHLCKILHYELFR